MHNKNVQCRNKEKGTAMALALLFSVILLGIGLALVFVAHMEQLTSSFAIQGTQTFYPADAETAYLTIGRTVVSKYSNWNDLLGLNATSGLELCNLNTTPAACVDEIANNYTELQDPRCKGRILRVPTGPANPGWNMSTETGNPFRLRCANSTMFCDCVMIIPAAGGGSRRLPQRMTFYIRNDFQDDTILQDKNGEVQLIAMSTMDSPMIVGASSRAIVAYDLTAWTQSGRVYDIHQTGSIQTLSGQ